MAKKPLLRRAEDLVPARYKTTALINMGMLIVIGVLVLVLTISNISMAATIKRMARDNRNMEITVSKLEWRIGKLEAQVNEQMKLFGELTYAAQVVQYRRPDLAFASVWSIGQKLTRGSRRYEVPLPLVLATAWAETDFHQEAVGLAGERSMIQVMKPTFYGMRPNGDWNDLDQVLDAGLHYLRVCYQRQQQRAPDDYHVVFAYYNAGSSHAPSVAVSRARKHMTRVDYVMREMAKVVRV